MEIEVKGHSGCSIEISSMGGGKSLSIIKSTRDLGYISRLHRQAIKQQEASRIAYQHIRVPEIYSIEKDDTHMAIQMEYVYSKNFIDYFEDAGFEQIDYFIRALKLFVDSEIDNSPLQTISKQVVVEKFVDVNNKVRQNAFLQSFPEVEEIMGASATHFSHIDDGIVMPVGKCHGDLTFSNILFNGNTYYLIDFLDSFVESPLLDIVKLRQDSAYLWSQLMYINDFDNIRLSIVCQYIDNAIDAYYRKCDWYSKYYKTFQLMNFLRILQYAKEKNVVVYLVKTLNEILYEL